MRISNLRRRGPLASVLTRLPYLLLACLAPWQLAISADLDPDLVNRGRHLFFQENFAGNGRTCGTCHPAENNFTPDPAYIAHLPDRQSRDLLQAGGDLFGLLGSPSKRNQAVKEMDDAIRVLGEAGLHPEAVRHLRSARQAAQWGSFLFFLGDGLAQTAQASLDKARADLLDPAPRPQLAKWSAR